MHPRDGWVDNTLLLRALREVTATHAGIREVVEPVTAVTVRGEVCELSTPSGQHSAPTIVLAAGAWVAQLAGLPRPLPIEPVRGQMVSFGASVLNHAVYGPRGYLVPRADGRTLFGATMERVGFDASTTAIAIDSLTAAAVELCPGLGGVTVLDAWAGLRPVTPDLLPILGRDPEHASLIYACGHSRNGILMAPLTADCIASLALGRDSPPDISAFSVERFGL
jgi:glycine oxidase